MTPFILLSLLLLILALLFIVVPLWRFRPLEKAEEGEIRRQKNTDIYEHGLAELEKDRQEALLQEEDYDRLRTELQRSFLRDMEDEDYRLQGNTAAPKKLVPLLGLLFVPVFSYGVYEMIGSARDLELPEILEALSAAETAEAQEELFVNLADFLQSRLDRREDDIQNGYMLGTLYIELEQFNEAITTFRGMADIMEDGPDKATVLGQLAQSMYLANESQLTPLVQQVIDETLAMSPNEYAVMSLLAIESFINQDFRGAINYWRRQLMQMDGNSQQTYLIRERIAQVEALLPTLAEDAPGAEIAEISEGPSVTLVVNLDESVLELLDDSMRLFVYARSPEFPMPLAAVNLEQPEFPFEITLTDANAMMPAARLSSAENVYVGVRLSRSGSAIAQSGDIQAESETFVLSNQNENISLSISEIVQ
jgi:cytochrome c-type biogenesis protein CcmH